jgi:hypothetical protein
MPGTPIALKLHPLPEHGVPQVDEVHPLDVVVHHELKLIGRMRIRLPEHGVPQMDEVHPLDVVVHHELQLIGHVGLVGLERLIHDRSGRQQVRRPLHHVRIVEVELDKGVLPAVVAVEGAATHSHRLVYGVLRRRSICARGSGSSRVKNFGSAPALLQTISHTGKPVLHKFLKNNFHGFIKCPCLLKT